MKTKLSSAILLLVAATLNAQVQNWDTDGNDVSTAPNAFIGTTNGATHQPLIFKVNSQMAGKIDGTLSGTRYATALGFQALSTNAGYYNTAFGYYALNKNGSGGNNTAVGYRAMMNNISGSENTAIGQNALRSGIGSYNTAIGSWSLYSNSSGTKNTATGYQALYHNTTGTFNTALGYLADVTVANLTNATAIGANAKVSASNSLVLGSSANVGIGTSSPSAKLDVIGTFKLTDGTQGAGKVLTSDASGNASWQIPSSGSGGGWGLTGNAGTSPSVNFIGTTDAQPLIFKVDGVRAGRIETSTSAGKNVFFGAESGLNNSGIGFGFPFPFCWGCENTAMGSKALFTNTTGNQNTALGYQALYSNDDGGWNTAVGVQALYSSIGAYSNTAVGGEALFSNTSGDDNVAIGDEALYSNTTGNENTAIGFQAGYSNTGSGNTFIGRYAQGVANITNSAAIGYAAWVTTSNTMVLGNADVSVVLGDDHPATGFKLSVNGKIICEEVKVQLKGNWPDYVFAKDHPLMPLEQLGKYIEREKRLPGMPSSDDVDENGGFSVGEMQTKVIEKTEENTLYILQLNNKIKELEKKIDELTARQE